MDIHIEKAWYSSDKPILKDFRLELKRGERLAIIGPSGCGKSTLLKILAGLHPGYQGTVALPPHTRTAFMPQKHCLLPWKTVYQNLVALDRLENKQIDASKAVALLADLGLKGLEKAYPDRLSGGQYQRVALGQAVFNEPELLLMDEPFSNLDVQTKREVQDVFLRIWNKVGMTTIFVTHNLEEAAYMQSRIVELKAI